MTAPEALCATQMTPGKFQGQTLLIDADDTLWQNNVYFERAIAAFISYLNHETMTAEEVRQTLNEVEHENVRKHGYGVASFQRALVTCFERLSPRPATAEHHAQIQNFAASIIASNIELLDGVAHALPQLASRHRLILMTKGNHREQSDKVARSGLLPYFSAVEIPPEKHPDAYREVCSRHGLNHYQTWMIGNSPRSDINPAIAAGLHAVYIHHPDTWVLEHESMTTAPEGQHLLEIRRFGELLHWF
ncbi:MAG: HAD family hydrolase [Acidobacteriaceae bacterium]